MRKNEQAYAEQVKIMPWDVRERPEYDRKGRRYAKSVGRCPECDGLVFEYDDRFACINSTKGKCTFSIDLFYLDFITMVAEAETMEELLKYRESNYYYNPCDPYDEEPHMDCYVKLVRSDDGRWYLDLKVIELSG